MPSALFCVRHQQGNALTILIKEFSRETLQYKCVCWFVVAFIYVSYKMYELTVFLIVLIFINKISGLFVQDISKWNAKLKPSHIELFTVW